jgi:hypothetical protein
VLGYPSGSNRVDSANRRHSLASATGSLLEAGLMGIPAFRAARIARGGETAAAAAKGTTADARQVAEQRARELSAGRASQGKGLMVLRIKLAIHRSSLAKDSAITRMQSRPEWGKTLGTG